MYVFDEHQKLENYVFFKDEENIYIVHSSAAEQMKQIKSVRGRILRSNVVIGLENNKVIKMRLPQ